MERIRAQGKTSLAPADVVIFTCDSTDIYIYIYIYIYLYIYIYIYIFIYIYIYLK